ncbi:MAG TPA: type II toxin-antitoxin system VapB family antitoxin [Rhizomicrobium sp.]
MATNLDLDPALIESALAVSGERTKKAAVAMALEEFVARRKQRRIVALMGTLEWDESVDFKKERSRAGSKRRSRWRRASCCLPSSKQRRHPGCYFVAQYPACRFPCQRFDARPATRTA